MSGNILFVNACVRKEDSRTLRLCRALLGKLGGKVTEVDLSEADFRPLDASALDWRTALLHQGKTDDPAFFAARQFASADTIVVAAPYWDMSFPAALKVYIENICVMGIASRYDETGRPQGLCRAEKLYYVTTAGGKYIPDFSFGQIDALAKGYFGIPETELICAEFLDIVGNDAEAILNDAIKKLN